MHHKMFCLLSLCAIGLAASCESNASTSTPSSFGTSLSSPGTSSSSVEPSPVSSESSSPNPSSTSGEKSTAQRILEQLQAEELVYAGTLVQHVTFEDSEEDYTTALTGLISDDRYYNDDSDYGITDYRRNADGNVEIRSLNPLDNTVESIEGKDQDGNAVSFDDNYFNPFDGLTSEDLSIDGNAVLVAKDEQWMETASAMLTMYTDLGFDTLALTIDADGNVLEARFTGPAEKVTDAYYGDYTLETTFAFTLETKEEAAIYDLPRDAGDAIPELDALFGKLAEGNYTVDYFSQYLYDGFPMSTYSMTGLYTEEGLLFDVEGEGATGLYRAPDGVAIVEEKDGKLVGASAADPDRTLSAYLAPFDYQSSVFVDEGDGVYLLPNVAGLYDFTEEINPVYALFYDEYPDAGSLRIEITGEDSCVFTYQVTSEGSYQGMYDDVRIEITDIGSTEWPYTEADYVPYTEPQSWADVDGAVELLDSYGIPADVLPFYAPSGSMVSASDYYGSIDIIPPDGQSVEELVAEYESLLSANGWEHRGQNDYEEEDYAYLLEDGTTLVIGVADEGYGYMSIYLYAPEPPATALTAFCDSKFSGDLNYTLQGSVAYDYYPVDAGEDEEPFRSGRMSFQQTYDAGAARQEVTKAGKTSADVYRNAADGVEHYATAEDGSFVKDEGFSSSSYSSYDQALFTMKDVAFDQFQPQADGSYRTDDQSVIRTLIWTVNATDMPQTLKSATVQLDEAEGTLTFQIDAETTVTDETGEYRVDLVYYIFVSQIGTTDVDLSFLEA